MASKDHFLSQVPEYQPWYKKWLEKIRSGRSGKKNKAPGAPGPQPPARQAADQNARMQQSLQNDQNFWYWHHHHYLNEPQPSPSSQQLPALSSPEPNQNGLKNADQSGFVETTAGIQQPNVSDCNNVPDSRVLTPPQDFFMENTGRADVYCELGTGDCQATEMYHHADATPDFYSDSYYSDSFASAD
jgi:hypothetical protein